MAKNKEEQKNNNLNYYIFAIFVAFIAGS